MSSIPSPAAPCLFLEWDSDLFGVRIARIVQERLGTTDVEKALAWSASNKIDCLYFLCNANDVDSIRTAEEAGFHLAGIKFMLERKGKYDAYPSKAQRIEPCVVRAAVPEDVPDLKRIAKISHRNTRFHRDGNFRASACDSLYERWIEKSVKGYAEGVFVACEGKGCVGYVTCHLEKQKDGRIGLFAVHPSVRGKGVGSKMLAVALEWFDLKGVSRVEVVTQGHDVGALRVYERAGFLAASTDLWYHKWFKAD